ncbi:hypothetical protein [Bradyrhizobium sp. CCBAU 53340]|uniref:hypothetical protein n=1 Tax=Bradyrhizobium sp. CCBAU 53340 TaxID=1325112 RepID=UPI00188ABB33|nr:hypothetical protein [Bradyrhizobium sp. CCBAU 53340]
MISLSPGSEWQKPLQNGVEIFSLATLIVLCWPLHNKTNRASVREKLRRPIQLVKMLEPSHVVILGLAIALAGAVWMHVQRSPQASREAKAATSNNSVPILLPDDGGPITWLRGQYIFGASGGENGVHIQSFQAVGQNKSNDFIRPLDGYVRSEITGKQFQILVVNDKGDLVSPTGYGIPAGQQFNLGARLTDSAGISSAEFIRDFGRITFVFTYGDHTYTKKFSPEEIEAEVYRLEKDLRPKPVLGAGARKY